VKSQFGYHILKLIGIRPAAEKTFEQMRSALESEYRRSQAEKVFNDVQDQLTDAALQSGQDIDAVAKKAGLPVKDVQNFSKTTGGGDLGASPKLIEAVFSTDVLDGHLSQIVQVDANRAVIVHATDHRLPQQKPLAEVESAVLAAVKAEQGKRQLAEAAAATVKSLEAGADWQAIGKSLGAVPVAPKFYGRADSTAPMEIRMHAFEAPKPSGKPQYFTVQLPPGDVAVVGYSALRLDPAPVAAEEKSGIRRQYAESLAAGEAESYAQAARASARIVENPAAFD
jgi:peptidyl-prolyl cis-trans isomerase D